MTDKELIQQAFNALNNMTDLFPDSAGAHSQEAEDACNAALVVMADLAARLQKPEKTNQCAETCERAKLCAVCGVSLNPEQKPVAWMYTNAQGKTVIVESDVQPYDDARPLYASPQPEHEHEPVAEVKAKMTGGNAGIATVIHEIYSPFRERLRPGDKLYLIRT